MIKHNQIINTIDENISNGIANGVGHLITRNIAFDDTTLIIDDRTLMYFSSYSYLGLEKHLKLQQACIEAVNRYGTQFGFSRAYVSIDLYEELESLLATIFDAPVVVAPSTTLAHQAAFPVLIENNDAVILDQQAHASIQVSIKMIRDRGVKVELVRHNRIDQIEEKIIALREKHRRVWYIPDGVYSMYGDYAPLQQLEELMNKYRQFHLYVDDAHGMSWTGLYGRGYTLSQIPLHPQMVLVTSLNKAFAASGGALILPNKEWHRKIRTCGGTLIFSTPIPPPMLGIAVASAKIHLTDELKTLQNTIKQKTAFFSTRMKQLSLQDISQNEAPVFYVPTGLPKVSYNLVKRMMEEGFYITPALFPAVSMKKAGLRLCVNVNHSNSDIDTMLSALARHYPLAMEEEGVTKARIYKSFNITDQSSGQQQTGTLQKQTKKLQLECYDSIEKINKGEWNDLLGKNGTFDWDGLVFLEKTFRDHPEKENNWQFYYYMVKDEQGTCVLATFFTKCWCKDDMFKPAVISKEVELKRKKDRYYLCTESLMMGSLLTEGQHLYLDKTNDYWKEGLLLLLNELNKLQLKTQSNAVYLRDFEEGDAALADLFIANGFVKTELPDYVHEFTHLDWNTTEEFLKPLKPKKRSQLRRDTLKYEDKYIIEIKNSVSAEELKQYYELYLNVKKNSFTLNTFDVPFKAFQNMNENSRWEMIVLSLKDGEYLKGDKKQPIAVVFCYKTAHAYIPLLVGLNYQYKYSHKNYKQAIYQVVKRAKQLKVKKVYFGITATTEKRRVGAIPIPKIAFVQLQDTYNMDVLELAKVNTAAE